MICCFVWAENLHFYRISFYCLRGCPFLFACLPVFWLMCLCILTISGMFLCLGSDFDLFAFCKNIKVFLHYFYDLYRKKTNRYGYIRNRKSFMWLIFGKLRYTYWLFISVFFIGRSKIFLGIVCKGHWRWK